MEPSQVVYNQAGPSNYVYSQEGRPPQHYGAGRGRGQAGHRHANGNHHPVQQQPFYTQGVPVSYGGYPIGMNGVNGAPIHGQFSPTQNGIPPGRRPGPSYQGPNLQSPTSPALHPVHLYNPRAPPYLSANAMPAPPPMYHYPQAPSHVQPYPAALSPPIHTPYAFTSHQNMKSPMISPLPEHAMSSSRPWKTRQLPSPRLLAPLHEQQKQVQSPDLPSNNVLDSPTGPVDSSLPSRPAEHQRSSPSPKSTTPVQDVETSLPSNSPTSPRIILHSFENEPLPLQEWVIAATRPEDPAAAFGIMISPKAKPPSYIVEGAQEYTPHVHEHARAPSTGTVPMEISGTHPDNIAEEEEDALTDVPMSQVEQVSCSTTETDSRTSTVADISVTGSPLSTATSVSVAPLKADSVGEKEPEIPSVPESEVAATVVEPSKAMKTEHPPASAATKSSSSSSSTKKSWASLLRSDGTSTSKTSLPMSSVQGFSIPASAAAESSSVTVSSESSEKRKELLRLLNNGPSVSGVPQIRPRGLVNTGNMCFANAVLQTLVYTPPFYRFFKELGKYINGTGSNATKRTDKDIPLVNATVEFLKEFKPKAKDSSKDSYDDDEDFDAIDSFIPSYVYDAMKENSRFENMGGGQQEDAEEFFGFFLDALEEELIAILNSSTDGSQSKQDRKSTEGDDWQEVGRKNKPVLTRAVKSVDSPITRIFGGKFRSTLRVPGQKDSVVIEDWRSLQLDIQREQVESIEDALRYISHPQTVQMSSVTKGGAVVDASQQVLVDSFPPILVLHLKRFLYDTTAKDVVKVHKQVSYGPELEIPSDAISPVRRSSHPSKYKLFAVLYHHGSSAAGGHYTLDVLHPNRNADANAKAREGWIRIDDELVTDLRGEDVFGSDRDCAYLLFYRRIGGSYARAGQMQ